ncbi:MAG: hypothetical protein ACKVP5_20045 [Aestuariivirga sp.]
MISRAFIAKSSRIAGVSAHQPPAAGNEAAARTPPAYGIEFVDQNYMANAKPLLQGKFAPVQRTGLDSHPASRDNTTGLSGISAVETDWMA